MDRDILQSWKRRRWARMWPEATVDNTLRQELNMVSKPTWTIALIAVLSLPVAAPLQGAVIQVGDLTVIDDAGNASDGLRFLNMSYSLALTEAAALANAQLTYADARLATPVEADDLFEAAGILYDGAVTASDGWSAGATTVISSGANYDGEQLSLLLRHPGGSKAQWFTDPTNASTRNFMSLFPTSASINSFDLGLSHFETGWLLVSDSDAPAVPAPATVGFLFLGLLGLGLKHWS